MNELKITARHILWYLQYEKINQQTLHENIQVKGFVRMESTYVFGFGLLLLINSISKIKNLGLPRHFFDFKVLNYVVKLSSKMAILPTGFHTVLFLVNQAL